MASDIIARGMASQGLDKVSSINQDIIPAKWGSIAWIPGQEFEIPLDISDVSIFNYENNNLTLQINTDEFLDAIWDEYLAYCLEGKITIYYNSSTYTKNFYDYFSISPKDYYNKDLNEWNWIGYYDDACSIQYTNKDGGLLTIFNVENFSELKAIELYKVYPMLYSAAIPYDDRTIISKNRVISTASPLSVVLTQAEYDALTTKDKETLYFIKEE